MVTTTLTTAPLLPEAELARVARVLARFLTGRQPGASGARSVGRAAGQGLDFLDFREYQPGDDFRGIDWRASARSNRIQLRRYCGEIASDWYLCVDCSASMGIHGGANWLLARQLAAALAYVLLHLGHRVGLLLFSGEIDTACPLGRGDSQYARILKTLSAHSQRSRGSSSDLGSCAAVAGRHHPLMVISDFLAEDAMLTALAKLRNLQRQLHLFQLDAATPWPVPDTDTLFLEDVETGRVATCGAADAARADAHQRLATLQQELSAWCRRYRIPLTRCGGGDNWRELLLRHFTQD